jgi:hypothetical protein
MNYRLVVLTHGPDFSYLERTLASFEEHVTPEPIERFLVVDGEHAPAPEVGVWERIVLGKQYGFCKATGAAWLCGANPGAEFCFYLEHDFEFLRPVDLEPMAHLLKPPSQLAQMALMRDAVNETEKAAGGLFESRPGQYERQDTFEGVWQRHRSYFTTNPSLMRTEFMRDHSWPLYPEQCEGRFGIDLIRLGFSFGVWGNGESWVRHIGQRTGKGY